MPFTRKLKMHTKINHCWSCVVFYFLFVLRKTCLSHIWNHCLSVWFALLFSLKESRDQGDTELLFIKGIVSDHTDLPLKPSSLSCCPQYVGCATKEMINSGPQEELDSVFTWFSICLNMARILECSDYLALWERSICSCQNENEWMGKLRSLQEQNSSLPVLLVI